MDIVSYGLANKVASDIKHVHENILGLGVEGNHPNMKSRIDALEKTIEGVNETANRLITNNAINLMKAHAKLNFVEKSIKYNMHHMIFDDLLDLSGIDTNLSVGYSHSSEQGWLQSIDDSCTIVTLPEITATVPEKAILTAQIEKNKFENVIPSMQGYISSFGRAYASSEYGPDWAAWRAFDGLKTKDGGNGQNRWASRNANPPQWLAYEFNTPIAISAYEITANVFIGSGQSDQNPRSWRFEGSNDGNNWIVLHEIANESPWGVAESRRYFIDNLKPFKHYRVYITQTFGSDIACIAELEMYTPSEEIPVSFKPYISRDNGVHYEPITLDELFYFNDSISPRDNKLRLKVKIPIGTRLLNYGITWA